MNLIFEQGMTEEDACTRVSSREHPQICGPACDPNRCDGRDAPPPIPVSSIIQAAPPAPCGCPSCTPEVWNRPVGDPAYTCGARIEYLQNIRALEENAACYEISALQFPSGPSQCGQCNPKTCGVQAAPEMRPAIETLPVPAALPATVSNTRCGCSRCTEDILSSMADGHSCSKRIDYLLRSSPHLYPAEEDACRVVANEFPTRCGPQCDPDRCHGGSGNAIQVAGNSVAGNNAGNVPPSRGFSRDMDLYCFPPIASRHHYENVWGKHTIQVKSGAQGCGPSDNIFSKQTVWLENHGRDLKLQFKKVGNIWHGAEVRLLLPQAEMPYSYGSYTFSVKTIRVVDSKTGSLISTVLPPSLVLGLFTWDPLEDFSRHENYNHEVDVEISRWNVAGNADAQFLVQPPGDPQTHRFFTGESGNTYQQAPRIYGFDWRPTEVEWYSNAGQGGQRFVYSTQDALDASKVDYNQCMPANVEVRINLWNLYGSTSNPPEMADTHVVEVLIDNFQFAPSKRTAVADGHVCSKDCQCDPSSRCIQYKCFPIARNGGTRRRLRSESQAVLTAPVILLLMVANLALAVVVIRRHWSTTKEDADDEIPFIPHGIPTYT